MAIDTAAIGRRLPEVTVDIERGRLRLFAKAIGETDPVYVDLDAARAAGHPDLPVPPTFFCALGHEQPDPFGWLDELGVDLRQVLHGEQSFTYHLVAYAGDRLTARPRITDIYARKGGALEFVVRETAVTRAGGEPVAELTDVVVVRNREVTA
ncbi:MaoC family dehydratase N-terminal domain-containing protein [Actinophytocola gossypii]|uniref:MaoC family dehydratase N-terminal domain-containing protein n=1 Tax=Actinophytocola gossypii TaxID=2812003 RepID=A0ABT2J3H7_9PSEU|nr:MaoC family dehydratase N-terminal domain-containing protein [Actinophytocola gossypii]MCT2582070.1 MaoC family dehydratase N-terminal domain-containing protein [Actinophytocola gossypii]